MSHQLIRFTAKDEFAPAGLPFNTVNQVRWCYRQRHENGFAEAFVSIGRTKAIDVPKFLEIARAQATSNAA